MANQLGMQATIVLGPYKGYAGRADYDCEADLFHGEVVGTRDVITFQSKAVAELAKVFRDSIEDYLAFCESRGESPEKPVSGKFLVRIQPEVHRKLVVLANLRGTSLNDLVAEALGKVSRNVKTAGLHTVETAPPASTRRKRKPSPAENKKKRKRVRA